MFTKKSLLSLVLLLGMVFVAGSAMAATSVGWVSPAEGSNVCIGCTVAPTGQASGSGGSPGTGLDLMLVIDVSGSMIGANLDTVKVAAKALINSLPDYTTQVGIVTFETTSHTVKVLQDLTTNKNALLNAVTNLTTGGVTATGEGINAATAQLIGPNAIAGHAKMQVVLSDGGWNSGVSPNTAAQNAWNQGITVHTVGIPGQNVTQMQQIASYGHGTYTSVSNLSALEGIFAGTGGNLVSLDHVDIQLPDGSWIYDIATDGLGNFVLPDWAMQLGVNTFTAYAYGTDGTSAIAQLNLNGINCNPVPEPSTMLLLGSGLVGLAAASRRKKTGK